MPHSKRRSRACRVTIVASRYNESLTDALLNSTCAELNRLGVPSPQIVRVPGSFEIPVTVARVLQSRKSEVVIALGVILQGKTSHADHIALASTLHLQQLSISSKIPVIHQILTPRNMGDARKRVKIRGIEAARVAVEMVQTLKHC